MEEAGLLWLALLAVVLVVVVAAWLVNIIAYRRRLRSFGSNLTRYAAENRALPPEPGERIVLFGDDVAERWDISRDFPELDVLNRGIAGETTLHLLARFHQDVVALEPRIVILLGGGNDPTWKLPSSASRDHFQLLARLARRERIELVLSTLLPVRRGGISSRLAASHIVAMNEWLRSFAQAQRIAYADFHAVLADKDGWLRPEFTDDGVHPNGAGYRAMAAVLCPVLERLLERAAARSGRAAEA